MEQIVERKHNVYANAKELKKYCFEFCQELND